MCCTLRSIFRHLAILLALCFGYSVTGATAANLAAPTGEIVLRIAGTIANKNLENTAAFDMAMLRALPQTKFTSKTTWTEGQTTFVGVSLKDLLEFVGNTGSTLKAAAVNDYVIDVPASDAVADGPIIAYEMNDAPMSVKDKGPLWLVYPYDAKEDYRTEETYAKSIWQLVKIDLQ